MRTSLSIEQQIDKLADIEKQMTVLLREAEGYFVVDNGYAPTEISQARLRFKESVMWAKAWIRRDV